MKKKCLLGLLVLVGLFIITGCGNEPKNSNKSNLSKEEKNVEKLVVGYYEAFEAVQYGVKSTGDDVKKEKISLLINEDNTASLSWGGIFS